MRNLRKGDEVVVIAGKDKGKRGSVIKVMLPKKRKYGAVKRGLRVMVTGINIMKKHKKADPQSGIEGGIVELEAAMDASNVALWNPKQKRADRIGFRFLEDGTKVRYFKSDGEIVDI